MRRSRVLAIAAALLFAGSALIVPAATPRALAAAATIAPGQRAATGDEPLKDTIVAWESHAPTTRLDGDPSWFNVTFDSTEVPAFGTLRIRDASTDTVLGSKAVTSTHVQMDVGLVVLALGSHEIVAEFIGDPAFVQASISVTIDVIPDTVIAANVFALNLTTFYPKADGYRNRLRIWGQCSEWSGCSPKVEIYTEANQIVRRWIFPAISQNQYKVMWDGRTASGTLLKAGNYRIHHTIVDWKGNALHVDQWVTLSYRTVRWTTVTVTWSGASYVYADTGGTGWISKSASSYAGGVRLGVRAAAHGGWANIAFRHRLHTGLAYRSMSVRALGRSLTAGTEQFLWCSPSSQAVSFTTTYRWYSTPVNSQCWPRGVAYPTINVYGTHARTVDVAQVRITYAYASWNP